MCKNTIIWSILTICALACQKNKDPLARQDVDQIQTPVQKQVKPKSNSEKTTNQDPEKALNNIMAEDSAPPIQEDSVPSLTVAKLEKPATPEPSLVPPKEVAPKPIHTTATKGRQLFLQAHQALKKRNWEKMRELYLASCQLGYTLGCHSYGWHQQKLGNLSNAARFYRISCQRNIGKSCNNLGALAETIKSYKQAENFYARGCSQNHKAACSNFKRLSSAAKVMQPNTPSLPIPAH